jgi:hypothetical protein
VAALEDAHAQGVARPRLGVWRKASPDARSGGLAGHRCGRGVSLRPAGPGGTGPAAAALGDRPRERPVVHPTATVLHRPGAGLRPGQGQRAVEHLLAAQAELPAVPAQRAVSPGSHRRR